MSWTTPRRGVCRGAPDAEEATPSPQPVPATPPRKRPSTKVAQILAGPTTARAAARDDGPPRARAPYARRRPRRLARGAMAAAADAVADRAAGRKPPTTGRPRTRPRAPRGRGPGRAAAAPSGGVVVFAASGFAALPRRPRGRSCISAPQRRGAPTHAHKRQEIPAKAFCLDVVPPVTTGGWSRGHEVRGGSTRGSMSTSAPSQNDTAGRNAGPPVSRRPSAIILGVWSTQPLLDIASVADPSP